MSHTEDLDFALALRLQEEENLLANIPCDAADRPGVELTLTGGAVGGAVGGSNSQESQRHCKSASSPHSLPPPGTSLVDEAYELIDPTPDIYQLFRDFDKHFFWGKLGGVELKWSPRMTRCAGVCSYQPASGLCSVRLSRPLLMLRPRSDLVETLLHEMIHALLFVTHHNDNREEHGPEFHRHMHRINKIAGTNITVYHTFHAEVKHMLTHWWRCTGPCRSRPPHFGYVKRSMNRAPSKNDFWWRDHQASCGGLFEKIKEPEGYGKKKTKKDTERPGKRPPPEGAGPPPQRRPGNPTGVRADIGTVNNDGNQRVNAIAGNVHGFQKRGGAVATAGGSRTVPQQGINDHVDQCLADPNEQLLGAVGGETRPENSGETVWYDDDDDDEQMLSLAADELERSLEVSCLVGGPGRRSPARRRCR
ncbi:SprT-like domain-containing protein Spartan [Amphibalanus amphitrite]|uniref:SprT-like domain-containing protein Spartan n=1 Tax=Amphibalanus amphitrite TaxID=1232801 RepID=A0A6A4V6F4_AMPAM|nr:SprT-like domain-containing protein Spartan [Amphibalanus amphitrite]